jgi:hypothetical protein
MKATTALVLALLLVASARADWKDVKAGMDVKAVWRCVGAPLIENKGKSPIAVWTYDRGGYVMFEAGRVKYWEAPKAPAPAQIHVLAPVPPKTKAPQTFAAAEPRG